VLEELPPSPPPLLLIWTARHPSELLVLAPRLFAAVQAKGVAITAHVHYTGNEADLRAASKAAASEAAAASPSEAAAGDYMAGKGHAAGTTPLCPVVALGGSLWAQAAHKASVHVLSCLGELRARRCVGIWGAALLSLRWRVECGSPFKNQCLKHDLHAPPFLKPNL